MSTHLRPVPAPDPTVTRRTFRASFACLSCAEAAERSLRAHAGIVTNSVNYSSGTIEVEFRPELIDAPTIEKLVAQETYDCRCSSDHDMTHQGGGLASLIHKADMAAVVEGTTVDRMQYEFPSTRAGKNHRTAAHAAHDMSDPRMAKAMEVDMRNRFVVALALTVAILLFSPLATNAVGLKLTSVWTANWLMLLLSIPVV